MKTVASRTISRFGFRNVLLVNAFVSSVFIAACAIFTPGMPVAVLIAILLVGGFFRALEFTAINAIAYADIDPRRMSRATALASVGQQLSISTGVAVGALMVEMSLRWRGSTTNHVPATSRRFPGGRGDFGFVGASCSGDCRPMPARKCPGTYAGGRDQGGADRGRRNLRSEDGMMASPRQARPSPKSSLPTTTV